MWVPKMKYIKGLFALKGIFKLPDGSDYEGPYHQDETGAFKTGEIPSDLSVTIIEDPNELTEEQQVQQEFFSSFDIVPTPKDYKRGFIIRYFLKDTTTNKIIEVDKNFYESKSDILYIQNLSIKWIIDKPLKDIFNQGYVYKGTISRNKESVMEATLLMKGIDSYITNFSKFADIESDVEGYKFEELSEEEQIRIIRTQPSNLQKNPPKKLKTNLYTPGGEYYIRGTMVEYVGNYHLHPEKGAMEGAVHTTAFHRQLTPIRPIEQPEVQQTQPVPTSTSQGSGGGGGGYGSISEEQEFGGPQEGVPGGGYGGGSNNQQNNYY